MGEACPNGGVRIEVGVDDNKDRTLTADEVDQIAHVCNGMNGQDSSASDETLLTTLSTPDAAMGCEAGGRVMARKWTTATATAWPPTVSSSPVRLTREPCSATRWISTAYRRQRWHQQQLPGLLHGGPRGRHAVLRLDDGIHGRELWAYGIENGTTWMVADINPGSDCHPGYFRETVIGDSIYFGATTPNYGFEMWSHNTVTGITQRVTDINPERWMQL